MNKALLRISLACLAMFVALLLSVNYLQAFRAPALAKEAGNVRVFNEQFSYQRGSIIAAGDPGTDLKIAQSRLIKGTKNYQRYYPDGAVWAPVTGYDTIYSATGIEESEDSLLNGTDSRLTVRNLTTLLTGKQKQGATVELTLSPAAQNAAYSALKSFGHPAAAVALNPATGAVLAMASYPSFDPNQLTTLDGTQLNRNDQALLKDPAKPLLNRATGETYPPGSTFKIVTSSAAFSTGALASPNTLVSAPDSLSFNDTTHPLINDGGETCGDTHPPVIQAFWLSCNTAFAKIGEQLGVPVLHDYASKFGLNKALSIPVPVAASVVPSGSLSQSQTADTAIGQFDDAVTPMQEAMLAATIANHGTLMQPYMVQQVLGQGLSVITSAKPSVLSQAVTPKVAGYVQQMMNQVTQNPAGTAYATANQGKTGGIVIDGKTGTAENGPNDANPDDAVFTCFVPGSGGRSSPIAVGVIVQGGGFGADAAAPIAVKIIQAYLRAHA